MTGLELAYNVIYSAGIITGSAIGAVGLGIYKAAQGLFYYLPRAIVGFRRLDYYVDTQKLYKYLNQNTCKEFVNDLFLVYSYY